MKTEVFSITAEDVKKAAEDLQRGPERSEEAQEVYDSLFKYFSQMISHSDFVKVVMSYMTVGEITGILSDNQKHKKYYIYEIEKPA